MRATAITGSLLSCVLGALSACGTPPSRSIEPSHSSEQGPASALAEQGRPGGEESAPEARPPVQPSPWTETFLGPSILVANVIEVEGPPGLFEHVVMRADESLYDRRVKTLPEGRLQSVRPKPGAPELDVVRGQLDAWQLAAFRELRFLEGLDPAAPVRVRALGDAVWRDTNGHTERGQSLTYEGEPPQQSAQPTARQSAQQE